MSLSLKNISKSYGGKVIIKDFSYNFPITGIVVITGASGVGKTTLLRIISGLEKKFTGSVIKNSTDKVSLAFQEHRLFPNLTTLENLTEVVFSKADEGNIYAAKNILYTLGFSNEEISLYPSELSGGMKQRVSLARAFLKESNILLLDEPTKELDQVLVNTVTDLINKEAKNKLVIIVSHDTDFIDKLNPQIIRLEYTH